MNPTDNDELLDKVEDRISPDKELEGMNKIAAKEYIHNKTPDYILEVQFDTKYHDFDWFRFKVYESLDGRYVTEFDDPTVTKYHIGGEDDTKDYIENILTMIEEDSINSHDEEVNELDLEIKV